MGLQLLCQQPGLCFGSAGGCGKTPLIPALVDPDPAAGMGPLLGQRDRQTEPAAQGQILQQRMGLRAAESSTAPAGKPPPHSQGLH